MASNLVVARGGGEYVPPISLAFWRWTIVFSILLLFNFQTLVNKTKISKKEIKISKLIGMELKKENIFFAGIDFIDQKLNGDINVTSPTGLKTLYDLSGTNVVETFWKELKV